VITTRLECSICNTKPQETKYESLSHAIGELLEEGWSSVTFQCDNVVILTDSAGDRLIIQKHN
jgi:hypothetical protein